MDRFEKNFLSLSLFLSSGTGIFEYNNLKKKKQNS